MKHIIEGFVIAAIGVAIGYGIAVVTVEPPEAVVIERTKEVPAEPARIDSAELKTLVSSMEPFAEDYWLKVCIGDIEPGAALLSLCREIGGAYERNKAALPVLTKIVDNDLVNWDDGAYDDES